MDTKKKVKIGRPLDKDVVQDEIVKFRVTPAEKEQIKQAAAIQDMTITDYIRNVILSWSSGEIGMNEGRISQGAYLKVVALQAAERAFTSSTGEVGPHKEIDFDSVDERYADKLDEVYDMIFNKGYIANPDIEYDVVINDDET